MTGGKRDEYFPNAMWPSLSRCMSCALYSTAKRLGYRSNEQTWPLALHITIWDRDEKYWVSGWLALPTFPSRKPANTI